MLRQWGQKELDMTEPLNNNSLVKQLISSKSSLATLFPVFISCLIGKGRNLHNALYSQLIHSKEISHSMNPQSVPWASEVITAGPGWLYLCKMWQDVCSTLFRICGHIYLVFSELRPQVKPLKSRNLSIWHPIRTVSHFPEFQSLVKI